MKSAKTALFFVLFASQITLPNAESATPLMFVNPQVIGGTFSSQLMVEPGMSYDIDSSPDLEIWTNLFVTRVTNSIITIQDDVTIGEPAQRFYRAKTNSTLR